MEHQTRENADLRSINGSSTVFPLSDFVLPCSLLHHCLLIVLQELEIWVTALADS
jgi:hypothetical protein